jgi:hypothetical protein
MLLQIPMLREWTPMLPHAFAHDAVNYIVSFELTEGEWCAALRGDRDGSVVPLPAFNEQKQGHSEAAIRAGYIAVAEWLVRSGPHPLG